MRAPAKITGRACRVAAVYGGDMLERGPRDGLPIIVLQFEVGCGARAEPLMLDHPGAEKLARTILKALRGERRKLRALHGHV